MDEVTVMEGSIASQLEKYVGDIVDGHPLWSARFIKTDPEKCIAAHRDYVKAGVQITTTATYQASVEGFMEYMGISRDEAIDIIKKSVKIAKEAIRQEEEASGIRRNVKVAGSIGPYGAHLHDGSEYTGVYNENITKLELIDFHRPVFEALIEEGVDLIAFETVPLLLEAEAMLSLLAEKPKQKAWLSFSCKDEQRISSGELFFDVVKKCWELGGNQLIAIGINCVRPSYVTPLITRVRRELPHIPLIVYPNSGENFDVTSGKWTEKETSMAVTDYTQMWLDQGVKYIGGCCRTNDNDIIRFTEEVRRWKEKRGL